VLIHTGQHYDENMSQVFFDELDIPAPNYFLGIGSGSHGAQTGAMLAGIEEVLLKEQPDCVLVYGDTNSTLAGALAAVKLHIKVAHVEAGLRSFNRRMPEEINRVLTDHISDLLLCPTQTAVDNLAAEGITAGVHLVGDVMYDGLLWAVERGNWDLILDPVRPWYDLRLKEVWRYRDLVLLFVRRDFVAQYKQTILGPLWFLIQPLLTTLIFTFIFGRVPRCPPTAAAIPVLHVRHGHLGLFCRLHHQDLRHLYRQCQHLWQGLLPPAGDAVFDFDFKPD
jgi:hypothetical protein